MLPALLSKKRTVYGATRQDVIVAREAVHKAIREVVLKDHTFRQLLEPSERSGQNRQYKNPAAFWHHFTDPLGAGVFSIVVQHPTNDNLVIKLMTRNNDGAILWHSAVYDSMRRGCIVQGAIQVYHMEDNPHGHGAWCILPKIEGFAEYCWDEYDNLPWAAMELAEELAVTYEFNTDIHSANVAYHRGLWVLTDPLSWSLWGRHVQAPKLNTCTRAPCSGWR